MIVLPIKKKWFDMIASGEKKEEYREIKPYYKTRFYNAIKKELDKETFAQQVTAVILYNNTVMLDVIFRNGYSKNSPQIKCKCIFKGKGQGKQEWGAEPNINYYILEILKIVEVKNYENLGRSNEIK